MKIDDNFELDDMVTGLNLKVVPGVQNCLRIESEQLGFAREFFFNTDGSFDGTGSDLRFPGDKREAIEQ